MPFMNFLSLSTFLFAIILLHRSCFPFSRSARLPSIDLLTLPGEVVRVRLEAEPRGLLCGSSSSSCCVRGWALCWLWTEWSRVDPVMQMEIKLLHNLSARHTFTLACSPSGHTLKAWFRCVRHIFGWTKHIFIVLVIPPCLRPHNLLPPLSPVLLMSFPYFCSASSPSRL